MSSADRVVAGSPVYYGWVIIVVGAIGAVMTSPGQTYAVSPFVNHFIAELGISRGLIATMYTVGTLTAAAILPLIGRLVDRHGARLMIPLLAAALAGVCILMSMVGGAVLLVIGFLGLRLFGQGSLSLAANHAVAQWWVRRRGMAIGIVGTVSALVGSGGFPNLIDRLIPAVGWRVTYLVLAAMLLAIMVPVGALLVRNRPEDHGLLPDGAGAAAGSPGSTGGAPVRVAEDNWTLGEAIRTVPFWTFSAGFAVMSAINTGLTFHLFSIFADRGLDSAVAAAAFVPMALTAALVQLVSGVLIDHVAPRLLLAVALVLETAMVLLAIRLPSPSMAIVFGVVMGVAGGLERTVARFVWPAYFGRRHLGAILGVATTIMVASSALGPMPIGIARDLVGDYGPVLLVLAPLPVLLAVATMLLGKPPSRPTALADRPPTASTPAGGHRS